MTFYVLVNHDNDEAFIEFDEDTGVPQAFATEQKAIEAAKTYVTSLVLKAVAEVAKTEHKITRVK